MIDFNTRLAKKASPKDEKNFVKIDNAIRMNDNNIVSTLSMHHKYLNEDEAAVDSVKGSQENIPEDDSESNPELNLNTTPFSISKLRDRRGKKYKVVFRQVEN
jgi:hypothetical protein